MWEKNDEIAMNIDELSIKINEMTIEINEITNKIDELTIKINEMTIKIYQKGQTSKAKNDHSEPDRPKIKKTRRRFEKKMIGFGRPDEIENNGPGERPPHAASKNVPNQRNIDGDR